MGKELEIALFRDNPEYNKGRGYPPINPSLPVDPLETQINPIAIRRIENYQAKAARLWNDSYPRWVTEKARVVEMLRFFPKEITIPQTVVKADDSSLLRETMLSTLHTHSCSLGIRTCYFPDRLAGAPWKMGIESEDEVREFIEETYTRWQETERVGPKGETLEEIIVLGNPPDLGKPDSEGKHFVFNTRVLADQILTEANLGTAQLRSIERENKEHFIEMVSNNPDILRVRVSPGKLTFGRSHWNEETIELIARTIYAALRPLEKRFNPLARLQGLSGVERTISNLNQLSQVERLPGEWPEEDEENVSEWEDLETRFIENVRKETTYPNVVRKIAALLFSPGYFLIDSDKSLPSLRAKISEAMGRDLFDEEMLAALIKPKALVATEELRNLIYEKWSRPPVDIFARLVAMNRACVLPGGKPGDGYDTIEVQGESTPQGQINYAKIYALRGREEKEFAKRATLYS